ncbi:hypothetical protein FOHLNKBM_1491 [Methylobacterium longum]|jgi:hypothetical protein|nr:hypothetical protein FOHLNKBM_1491 [Methylobacterium longum]
MKRALFALLAVASVSAPAVAETGTQRAACTPDVMRL